jgi:hypothetical protein
MKLNELLTEIVVTPWATSQIYDEVCSSTRAQNCGVVVRRSDLAPYKDLLPHQPVAK